MIPMHDTPIYAQLKAEYAEPKYGTVWVKVLPDMSKFREQRKPLAKNRKARR